MKLGISSAIAGVVCFGVMGLATVPAATVAAPAPANVMVQPAADSASSSGINDDGWD